MRSSRIIKAYKVTLTQYHIIHLLSYLQKVLCEFAFVTVIQSHLQVSCIMSPINMNFLQLCRFRVICRHGQAGGQTDRQRRGGVQHPIRPPMENRIIKYGILCFKTLIGPIYDFKLSSTMSQCNLSL